MKPRTILVVLLILILAAGTSYWIAFQQHPSTVTTTTTAPISTVATRAPIQFAFFLGPPFFHVAPAEGKNITAVVQRSSSFSGAVRIEIVNPPNWVAYKPATIRPKATNATFMVFASKDAPKTELNLTVRASSAGAADQFTLLDMKVVGVSNVTGKIGSAVVYDTTKVLLGQTLKTLTSYSNGTFVFSTMTPQLQGLARGDVMIVPPKTTKLAKEGLMRSVLSVSHQGTGVVVKTVQASLFDELQALNIGNNAVNATAFSSSNSFGPSQYSHVFSTVPDYWYYDWYGLFDSQFGTPGPVDIGGGDTFSAGGHFAVAITPGLHFTWSNGLDYFRIHLGFVVEEDVSLTGNAGTSLNWDNPNLGTLYDNQILIFDDLVWLTVKVTMEGRASGNLNQNINLNIHQKFGYEVGPTYDSKGDCYPNEDPNERCGWFLYSSLSAPAGDHSVNSVTPGTGSGAKVEVGPRFEVAINGGLGGLIYASVWGSMSADFYMQLNSMIPRHPASWWVDWGVDAYAGIGLSFGVLWGLYTWDVAKEEWGPENLHGPDRLFEGTTFPPVVAITYPQPEQVFDVSAVVMAQGFKATAISPQDGDLCNAAGATLVWTDEDGQVGKGCNLQGETFKHDGDYHITFTATDTVGQTTRSQPVHVTVTVPKPKAYITSPTTTDTFTVEQPVTLAGGASVALTDLSCDKLTFTIYPASAGTGSPQTQTLQPSRLYGPLCSVNLQKGFPSAEPWSVVLTATDTNGQQGTAQVVANVRPPPKNPWVLGPWVTIELPGDGQDFVFYKTQVPLQGTITSSVQGEDIKDYTWTATWGNNAPTKIGQGDLSQQDCSSQNGGCTISGTWNSYDYCTLANFKPIEVTITLDASQGPDPNGKWWPSSHPPQRVIKLDCQTPPKAPPSLSLLLWAPSGVILADRGPGSWSGNNGLLTKLLLRLKERIA